MTFRSVLFWCAALAVVCFAPRVEPQEEPDLRQIDANGHDDLAKPGFAVLETPKRDGATPLAPLHDLAYAANDAGPDGCLWVLGGAVALAVLLGLWSRGFSGALRRGVLVLALGGHVFLALLYTSCLLEGRVIRLGPDAAGYVAASLHNHTDQSTGLLSPKDLVIWHAKRGFRVLNVSDKDTIRGGLLAQEALARIEEERGSLVPPLVVTVGDEWHGQPDIVFVNTTYEPEPPPRLPRGLSDDEVRKIRLPFVAELSKRVHDEGGALFLAHPWSKVPPAMSLEDLFDAGIDGVEAVNGVIHGGEARIRAALMKSKRLFGTIDYKFGPHVNAITLLDERLARTPAGVAEAVRTGPTIVLYAIPGGQRSGEEWKAGSVGLRGVLDGVDSLRAVEKPRRAVWFAWGALGILLWWVSTRSHKGLGKAAARALFVVCAAAELALLLLLWDRVRFAIGTVPVPITLAIAGVLAVPLLVASHSLALLEHHR